MGMVMGVDHPGHHQPAGRIQDFGAVARATRKVRADGSDI